MYRVAKRIVVYGIAAILLLWLAFALAVLAMMIAGPGAPS